MDVEITQDTVNQTATVSSSKYLAKFFVKKAAISGIFFKIELENSVTPSALSGRYTSMNKAIEAIQSFLLTAKETQAAKNERLDKERKERNAVRNSKGL